MESERLERAKKLQLTKPRSKATKEAIGALSPEEFRAFDAWVSEALLGMLEEVKAHLRTKPSQQD
jgi:hypothetical protein